MNHINEIWENIKKRIKSETSATIITSLVFSGKSAVELLFSVKQLIDKFMEKKKPCMILRKLMTEC